MHLNLQFREPLAPSPAAWQPAAFVRGLEAWQAGSRPFTAPAAPPAAALYPMPAHAAHPTASGSKGNDNNSSDSSAYSAALASASAADSDADYATAELCALLATAKRGILVVGELLSPSDAALVVRIGRRLGWPVVADILSGLRVGATKPEAAALDGTASTSASIGAAAGSHASALRPTGGAFGSGAVSDGGALPPVCVIDHMDHVLLGDKQWWAELKPDVILQIGPRLTSKRVCQFLEWAAADYGSDNSASTSGSSGAAKWAYVAPHTLRHDAAHLITHRQVNHRFVRL